MTRREEDEMVKTTRQKTCANTYMVLSFTRVKWDVVQTFLLLEILVCEAELLCDVVRPHRHACARTQQHWKVWAARRGSHCFILSIKTLRGIIRFLIDFALEINYFVYRSKLRR